MQRLRRMCRLLAGASLVVLALGAPAARSADTTVTVRSFDFRPPTVTIVAGDTVTWVNRDSVDHTATARNGSFDTGSIGEDRSRAVRFTVPGRYRYICTPHPQMTGVVVVRAAGLTPPATDMAIEGNRDEPLRPIVLITASIAIAAWIALERRRPRRQSDVTAVTYRPATGWRQE